MVRSNILAALKNNLCKVFSLAFIARLRILPMDCNANYIKTIDTESDSSEYMQENNYNRFNVLVLLR